MVKKLCHIILLLGMAALVHAQQDTTAPMQDQQGITVEVQAWANVRLATLHSGWDLGRNGAVLSVGVDKPLKKGFRGMLTGEVGAAGIGNYLAWKAGVSIPFQLGSSRWAFTPGLSLLQGMTLARPDLIYMWGFDQANAIDFKLKNSSGPGFVLGFRLYGFPGYREYSKVNSFVDLRLGVRYTF